MAEKCCVITAYLLSKYSKHLKRVLSPRAFLDHWCRMNELDLMLCIC